MSHQFFDNLSCFNSNFKKVEFLLLVFYLGSNPVYCSFLCGIICDQLKSIVENVLLKVNCVCIFLLKLILIPFFFIYQLSLDSFF